MGTWGWADLELPSLGGGPNPHISPVQAQIRARPPIVGRDRDKGTPRQTTTGAHEHREHRNSSHPISLNSHIIALVMAPQHSHLAGQPPSPLHPTVGLQGDTCHPPPRIHIPDLRAAVLEELEELGDHDVEGPVERIAVQELRRVLADLLQGPERPLRARGASELATAPPDPPAGPAHLACVVVLRIEQVAELRQQLRPHLQLPLGGDGGDEDACGRVVSAGRAEGPQGGPCPISPMVARMREDASPMLLRHSCLMNSATGWGKLW